jgi:hypothetical protein
MVQARWPTEGLDAVWSLLVELAWLAPARFGAVVQGLGDPLLDRLRRQFDAEFEGRGDAGDLAWFPAWLLTQKAGLARLLGAAQPSASSEPEQAIAIDRRDHRVGAAGPPARAACTPPAPARPP